MKSTFNSLDIACCVYELQALIGMRVTQIYDVDHKTYLLKLQQQDKRNVLLIESGARFHTTKFEWPKNSSPSSFTMKLRKHLKNKRIESIKQLGNDRIVDFQFGTSEFACHVILELFNRGNIILTDQLFITLNVLSPHTEGELFKFSVREVYPKSRVRDCCGALTTAQLQEIFANAKTGDKITKLLLHHLDYGAPLIEHILILAGLNKNSKFDGNVHEEILATLSEKLKIGEEILNQVKTRPSKGYVIKTEEPRIDQESLVTYVEFHPYLFIQNEKNLFTEFDTFNAAVDEYYSKTEGQKIELRMLQLEKDAWLKVERIKDNQLKRIENLAASQEVNRRKAELIMSNSESIDQIIMTARRAIAVQMTWPEIGQMFDHMARWGHSSFNIIHRFKLEMNQVVLALIDPYEDNDTETEHSKTLVDIDLSLSACANATRYYSDKKSAAIKEQKTLESQDKALKSATKKAKITLKDLKTTATITKARKVYWFEKFYWFISSDNYLVIAGRDQQQNEVIVKKYLKKGDIYVHADLSGASSVVIKNPLGTPVPPRTLNEAGNMAVSYSIGWEAKVLCSAWWVYHDQVSKAAPAGEYLTTGSFMIRGQKNFLLPAQLALGFGYLFKIEQSSLFRHAGERKPKTGLLEGAIEEEDLLKVPAPQQEIITIRNDDATPADEETVKDIDPSVISETIVPQDDILETLELPDPLNCHTVLCNDENSKHERASLLEGEEHAGIAEIINHEKISKNTEFPDVDVNLSHGMHTLDLHTTVKFDLGKGTKTTDRSCSGAGTSQQAQTKDEKGGDKNTLKRGQRSKLKKIKEKYKDQDEEDKRLRMSILKSDGMKKEPKKSKKIKHPEFRSKGNTTENRQPIRPTTVTSDELGDEDDDTQVEELDVIDFLTGQPHPEDELLFAVPVVAPYTALLNYKYKVKMIPGTGKRGKSARSAQEYFLRLKESTVQEKALIKNVNDNTLSRNFPGKVKLAYGVQRK